MVSSSSSCGTGFITQAAIPELAVACDVAVQVLGRQQDDAAGRQHWILQDTSATARPSVPGMRASSSTSANGRPEDTADHRALRALRPSATASRLGVPAPQPLLEDLAVGRVVVDDQDAQAVQVDPRSLKAASADEAALRIRP
jgi:hypothetical protein